MNLSSFGLGAKLGNELAIGLHVAITWLAI